MDRNSKRFDDYPTFCNPLSPCGRPVRCALPFSGRSIHEDRIIEQRLRQQYRGPLAHNIQCLMEYLFVFPTSPQRELGELPIKLWNRYLPDDFDEILKRLFGIPSGDRLD